MNEQNKPKQEQEAPKTAMGESSAAKSSGWKKALSKRWVSPAVFVAAAAIIVTLMWIYQGAEQPEPASETSELTETEGANGEQAVQEDTLEVTTGGELMQYPVANRDELEETIPYYNAEASGEERAAAMLQTGNTFTPHTGIDWASPNDETFDVLAALSGKISRVEKHPTNGGIVEITHGDGLTTVYQSLADIQVENGEDVKQGTVIAKAGRNELEKDQGVHLHFEVLKDGKPIDPNILFDQQ
ncbi:peptidase M23 [Paenibacillus sp. 32O-W]|uniref:M23 family metallopeptidase n=1 Tax=Paenibacillus sp. 32O-W TaxID=1695218 RepID=UPI000722B19D|nr:M23 family metallopeptidase [Paenibacillus sp. 32O-W]ALS26055.1 peptidase M23 [Paenibacillus sp. 32O-W]